MSLSEMIKLATNRGLAKNDAQWWPKWMEMYGTNKSSAFNIGGNKYRLITRILYPSQKVFVLKCMTHAEYDEDKWKTDCGCYESPPAKSGSKSKAIPVKRKKKGT